MSRRYAYQYALPFGRVEIDVIRTRAIQECYRKAVDEGYYPIAKPVVELDLGEGFRPYDVARPVLRVFVECLP